MPEITRQVGKALKKKGFSLAKEFCWNREHDNAYAGEGTVDEIVTWLIEKFDVVKDDTQYPGHVNLLCEKRLIQVQLLGIGKHQGKVLVVLPFTRYNIPDGPPKREE